MMHKPQYDLIAKAIKDANCLYDVVLNLIPMLQADNPKFNAERFVAACDFARLSPGEWENYG